MNVCIWNNDNLFKKLYANKLMYMCVYICMYCIYLNNKFSKQSDSCRSARMRWKFRNGSVLKMQVRVHPSLIFSIPSHIFLYFIYICIYSYLFFRFVFEDIHYVCMYVCMYVFYQCTMYVCCIFVCIYMYVYIN